MSLADEMQNDWGVFFNVEDFAKSITYFPASGVSYSIPGIFDSAYESVNVEGTIPVASTSPMLKVQESALHAAPAPGDQVVIDSIRYDVMEPQPDGLGIMKLRLQVVE
jgi:hypothetical protein